MKFLHTADWHLGVKTNGRDRLLEQKRVIDEILSIANYENIDCIILAGDIFNNEVITPQIFNLTQMFGAGNEPTKEWCDENL